MSLLRPGVIKQHKALQFLVLHHLLCVICNYIYSRFEKEKYMYHSFIVRTEEGVVCAVSCMQKFSNDGLKLVYLYVDS